MRRPADLFDAVQKLEPTLTVRVFFARPVEARLRFEPVEWIRSDDPDDEIRANTQNFTRLIEEAVRRYPDHWLWVHRRWKTRPPGEPPLYPL